MRKTLLVLFDLALLLVSGSVALWATTPASWILSTQREFLTGELTGVSVTSDGKLTLAPAFKPLIDTEEALIHALAADQSGDLYLGTGNNGKIFRVSPDGKSQDWAQLDELGVHALAFDSADRLYAGTSPEGKVYRLDQQGESQIFFDPEEKYIWALATDRHNNLLVGTGPKGIIYKVTPEGKHSLFYDSTETHVISLEWDLDGNLLAGSAPGGLLFRIAPTGVPFVLYDSPLEEIKAIAVDRYGVIYAAALASGKSSPKNESAASTNPPKQATQKSEERKRPSRESTRKIAGSEKGSKLEVYRIDKESLVETLYSSDDELAFDLLIRSDGNLLVATGNKGRILSIDRRKFVTLLVQSSEQQVTGILEREGQIHVATSNLGKLLELLPQPSTHGTYQSRVFDAKVPSLWGMIRWRVTNPTRIGVKAYTRSGNTAAPDQTWSEWDGPYKEVQGSYIQAPPARYLQWKIEFPEGARSAAVVSQDNAVDEVKVTYIQRNMAPQVTSITVHPPGVSFLRYPVANAQGAVSPGGPDGAHLSSLPKSLRQAHHQSAVPRARRVYVPRAQSFSWTAKDPNEDDLESAVYYRAQDESSWKLLKKGLTETYCTIDAVSFPDGIYLVKVVTSDRPSNPTAQTLESELVSKGFVITNSSPSVELDPPQVRERQLALTFTAKATASTIYQAEYSIDAGEWNVVFPEDRIADSHTERYSLTVDDLAPGERSISIRIVDSVGNIGTGKTAVTIE